MKDVSFSCPLLLSLFSQSFPHALFQGEHELNIPAHIHAQVQRAFERGGASALFTWTESDDTLEMSPRSYSRRSLSMASMSSMSSNQFAWHDDEEMERYGYPSDEFSDGMTSEEHERLYTLLVLNPDRAACDVWRTVTVFDGAEQSVIRTISQDSLRRFVKTKEWQSVRRKANMMTALVSFAQEQ